MSVLFAYGSQLLSHRKTVALTVGTAEGTLANLTGDVLAEYAGAAEVTATFVVDLGSAQTPDLVMVANHNLSVATVALKGSNNSDLSSPVVDTTMTVGSPNFWKDLRSISSRTARYWGIVITSNASAIKLGKIVIATVTSLQTYQWGYTNRDAYLEMLRGVGDYGVVHRTKLGVKVRAREVTFVGPHTVETTVRAISRHAGRNPGAVVMVPDDAETDAWFVDWSDGYRYKQVADNRREVGITIQEQSPGSFT